ncbi:MAG: DJ-1/PfpI family protein [Endozoicomonas sp.]|uniref:DJ-1/PfpI family protein n=1 Tax=Endozoicomonas sp. TaxID=1892382 RepID=UPI003D9B5B09
MNVGILTLDGFNELDSLIAYSMINRLESSGLKAHIIGTTASATSMNGLTIKTEKRPDYLSECEAVIIGSGSKTLSHLDNEILLNQIKLNDEKQLISSQCSGALILQTLGFLENQSISTDQFTRSTLETRGYTTNEHSFSYKKKIATSGGCLASTYLATWITDSLLGREATVEMLEKVLPVDDTKNRIAEIFEKIAITAE